MKKLKSVEEYLDNDDLFCYSEVEDIVRKVQIDAIKTTAENCAEESRLLFHDGFHKEDKELTHFQSGENNLQVSKQSILNIVDKMIEKL